MATISGIMDRVRLELADQAQSFVVTVRGDGTTKRFDIGVHPLKGSSLAVKVNGTAVATGNVSVEERTGIVILSSAPAANSTVEFSGLKYRYFTDADLQSLCEAAVAQHLHNRTDSFGRALNVSNLPAIEEYPVALLSAIECLYALATDAAFDIDIMAPDGVNIPRSERYRQLMDMIATRREQYQGLCEALNIGLHKIEVFTLRRISRMTNKYVPVYMPQEIDDYSRPTRVYLPIPTYGGTAIPTSAAIYDLVFTQGDAFSVSMDFPWSLSAYVPKAQIRQFPESQVILAEFAIAAVNGQDDKVELSLTPAQTARLPLRSVWDMQLTSTTDPDYVETYVKGQVFVERQVTQ